MSVVLTLASQLFEKSLINDLQQNSTIRRAKYGCIGLSTLAASMLLIALCHTSQIDVSTIYTLFVVFDAVSVATNSWYFIIRIFFSDRNETAATKYKFYLLKVLIAYINDLLESISVCLAIFFGMFVRRRMMSLLLVSHVRRLLQRIFFFEYPEFEQLVPELKAALI
uniref:Uncharacterized protein n=1 Tax=Panagrolaimus sp. JU765 TaxID=591449 RepID=A0AC34QVA5_9BILA